MCEENYTWKNIEITWENEDIDYYVIINHPCTNDYFDKKENDSFQMKPWVNDKQKNWGVKTWGIWAEPNPNDFLGVVGRKSNTYNNVFWQMNIKLKELEHLKYEKQSVLSCVTSNKYFDEGHIARIDFLRFLEGKGDIPMHIYGNVSNMGFQNYQKEMSSSQKGDGIIPYKYYFMVENNYEENFITEKLWEPILCESLVFYYGCPNVDEYIDNKAFVMLDMNDFEKSYQIIKTAIEEDWWS